MTCRYKTQKKGLSKISEEIKTFIESTLLAIIG
jgi:hypothetical protein